MDTARLAQLASSDLARHDPDSGGRAAGIETVHLRHTFVSLLLRDPGYSRVEVAAQAGHSLQVQDRTYAHVIAGLRGEGNAEEAIRRARAEVLGQGTAEATGQMR